MSCRCAPAACAAAAAAIAFCTIIRARPSKVAGSVCTQAIGIVRRPSLITIISPRGPFSSTTALPPRRTQRSTSSLRSCIENRITEPLQALRIPATSSSSAFRTAQPVFGTASTTTCLTAASCSSESMPFSPRWSPVTFRTTATSFLPYPSPSRRIPPRAVSNTAKSIRGFCRTICADLGPLASARLTRRSSM